MNYEDFKEKFIEDVSDRFYEQGAEVNISVHEVNKLNESYEAITVTPEGSNIGVNVGIDKFFRAYENGIPYEEVVARAVDTVAHGIAQRPEFDVESLTDYSQMKEKLAMEVVSAEANKNLLETVPHKNMGDMAVVYRFVLSSDDDGRASILVTNQILESMGVTPEQLHTDALENAPQIKPAEIRGVSEVMAELVEPEQAKMMGIVPMDPYRINGMEVKNIFNNISCNHILCGDNTYAYFGCCIYQGKEAVFFCPKGSFGIGDRPEARGILWSS